MTLDDFLKKHPRSVVGRPTPSFPLTMAAFCAGVVALMLRMILDFRLSRVASAGDVMAPLGALTLSFSFFLGAVICAQRALEVIRWRRGGRCSFAVNDGEALLVGQEGQSVLVPITEVTKLEIHIHTVTLAMQPGFAQKDALARVVCQVLQPGGDGPTGRAFFNALAPRVRALAPAAEIASTEPSSLWAILRSS